MEVQLKGLLLSFCMIIKSNLQHIAYFRVFMFPAYYENINLESKVKGILLFCNKQANLQAVYNAVYYIVESEILKNTQ